MYAFVDRHPSSLGNSGRFLLWAMRGWVQAVARKSCPSSLLQRGFTGVGLMSALPHFHLAMALLHRDSCQRPRMGRMGCCRIHEDEAILLSLWHAVAREDSAVTAGTLEQLLKDEDAIKPVARAMVACTAQLALGGFDLTETHAARIEK